MLYGIIKVLFAELERAVRPSSRTRFMLNYWRCAEGLKIAAQMGMAQVILETDASMVKTAIEGDEYRLSSMGGVITEIKHLMAMEFSSCVISICSRNCNKLAHEPTSLGCSEKIAQLI